MLKPAEHLQRNQKCYLQKYCNWNDYDNKELCLYTTKELDET